MPDQPRTDVRDACVREAEERVADAEARVERAELRLRGVEPVVRQLQEDVRAAERRALAAEERTREAEDELAKVIASRSWQVTAPLRALARWSRDAGPPPTRAAPPIAAERGAPAAGLSRRARKIHARLVQALGAPRERDPSCDS